MIFTTMIDLQRSENFFFDFFRAKKKLKKNFKTRRASTRQLDLKLNNFFCLTVLTPEFTLQERAFVWGKSGLGSRRRRFLRSWNACDLRWWNETIEGPIRRMKGHRTIELDILRRTESNPSN